MRLLQTGTAGYGQRQTGDRGGGGSPLCNDCGFFFISAALGQGYRPVVQISDSAVNQLSSNPEFAAGMKALRDAQAGQKFKPHYKRRKK